MMQDMSAVWGVDMETGWFTPPGLPEGLKLKTLASTMDVAAGEGMCSRLALFGPGVATDVVIEHPFWEESVLISGDLSFPSDIEGEWVTVAAPAYFSRPPGTPHGPFRSERGCLLIETQFFAR